MRRNVPTKYCQALIYAGPLNAHLRHVLGVKRVKCRHWGTLACEGCDVERPPQCDGNCETCDLWDCPCLRGGV